MKDHEEKLEEMKLQLKEFQKKELDRLNKEFVVNDYSRRFKIDQETIISTIIGKELASNEYCRKLREQKVYI